jgi:DNA mismatch repair ATPase MutS
MSGTALTIVIVVAVVVVIAAIALAVVQSRRRRALRERFGPEYDRTMDVTDNKRQAHRELRERAAQRDQLEIRELTPAAASRYQQQWTLVQQQFVDAPAEAVREAQQLVTTVMRERGYPTDNKDERESMLSVDHADIVDRYRTASEIESRSQAGRATTEDLRQAMQHYRSLFDALLGSSLTSVYNDDEPTDAALPPSTGRRESRVSPDA